MEEIDFKVFEKYHEADFVKIHNTGEVSIMKSDWDFDLAIISFENIQELYKHLNYKEKE